MNRFAILFLCAACAHGGPATSDSLRGLPARHDPPLDLGDDEDLNRARAAWDALPLDDPGRAARRRELWAAYQQSIAQLVDESREEAFRRFALAIEMWDEHELADAGRPAPDLELVAGTADSLYKQFSTSGSDVESATALAVLAAAHPERAAEYDKTWNDIVAYTNDLAVAEAGPGAERSRAIVILENVTAHFPSRWAADKLIALYLARQEVINKALQSGNKESVLGAHRDPGVVRPVWNLVRIYVRTARFDEAADAADKLAGQFGDQPELRKQLRATLGSSDGKDWVELTGYYNPDLRHHEEGDIATSVAICEEGARRLPKASEARKFAGELAMLMERVPVGLRWITEARKLTPDDREIAEIAAQLYVMRLGDAVVGERLDAARQQLPEIEAFYADTDKRWPDKPLRVSLGDAYVTFARGLFNLGEIEASLVYLEKAKKLGSSAQATEELATIAMKTGRAPDAARGYGEAAAMTRETPLLTSFEAARLHRLQGEALAAAGQRAQAEAVWKKTLDEWNEVRSAGLIPRRLAEAYTEMGRLLYDLGDEAKGLRALNAAVDTDQSSVFGEVIAFLVTHGQYDAALDAYHRALGRPEVTEYLKVYTSLWLYDLGRLSGHEPDPLLAEYLKTAARGNRWYQQLARFKLKQIGFDGLVAKADTRGKRAEAYFYQAMNRYVEKDRSGAEKLLHDVKATEMLGFFEFDMATYFLANGPPGRK